MPQITATPQNGTMFPQVLVGATVQRSNIMIVTLPILELCSVLVVAVLLQQLPQEATPLPVADHAIVLTEILLRDGALPLV